MADPVALPMLAETVLLTARSVKQNDRPPLPSEFAAMFVVFGGAALLGAWDPRVGTVFGWGIVLATALNVMPFVSSGGVNPQFNPAGPGNPNPGRQPTRGPF